MIEEGRVELEIGWDGNRVSGVSIRSTRPADAGRLLEGRGVAQAVETVPLLFSVCARAQVVAAALASEAASGERAEPALVRLRERMVAAEWLHETLWHLLLDLPPLLGEAPQHEEFVAMRRRLAGVAGSIGARARWWEHDAAGDRCWCDLAEDAQAFLARAVYGMPCDDWLGLAEDDFMGWKDRGATPAAARLARLCETGLGDDTMPALPAGAELLEEIAPVLEASGEFVRLPSWKGAPAETGAWARQAKHPRMRLVHGIGARMLARLIELAHLPHRLRDAGASCSPSCSRTGPRPGTGMAAVETARGTLVHAVRIEEGRLARLRIVAPTQWNFHPEGAFARGLAGIAARDEAQVVRAAALLAHALDPCVAFAIRVEHA